MKICKECKHFLYREGTGYDKWNDRYLGEESEICLINNSNLKDFKVKECSHFEQKEQKI